MRGELAKYVAGVAARAANLKPIWGSAENILRRDAKEQLEGSYGPDGKRYARLKSSTLKKKKPARRSERPYDLKVRKTWNLFIQRGAARITKRKDGLNIKVQSKGAFYVGEGTKYMDPRPVGTSEKAADDIANLIADYVMEKKQAELPGVF